MMFSLVNTSKAWLSTVSSHKQRVATLRHNGDAELQSFAFGDKTRLAFIQMPCQQEGLCRCQVHYRWMA